jgi:hypothetical protein
MCNWCGCQAKQKGYGGKTMPNNEPQHERTESQIEQIMEYGKVKNKKAPKS